jgi:hypothetical protein
MQKQVLMVHEICDNFFDVKNLEEYILTFDDGLYNHFLHFNELKKIKTEKIFFISTSIICEGKQSDEFLDCKTCHEKAFSGNKENYMNLEQIKMIKNQENFFIGGHSHFHKNLNEFLTLNEKVKHIKTDTELMLNWFEKNLNFKPLKFCFPYNNDVDGLYKIILKKYGFTDFFGKERITI